MALKFRRGTTAQKSGSLAFGEPFVNTDLNTLQIGGPSGDITLGTTGESSAFAGVSVSASSFISGSGLKITGNAAIDGNLTLGGAITIGDATADTVNVVASLSSSLIPQTTNAFDLGSTTKIWRDLYISTGSIKFVAGTTVVKELTLATLTALEAATGSLNTSITNLNSATASLNTSVSNLNAASSSYETKGRSIVSGSSQIDITSTTGYSTFSTSVDSRLDSVELVSASAAGALNSVSGAFNTTINNLGSTYATDAELSAVSSAMATRDNGQDTTISTLSSSVNTRLITLEGKDISVTLTGDVTGTGTITDLGNVSFATTIAANSVALGTDTTGNYMSDLTQGTGVTITHTPGEGSNATIAIGQAVGTTSNVTFGNVTATGTVSGSTFTGLGNLTTYSSSVASRLVAVEGKDFTITLTGDVTGTGTVTDLGNVSFATTIAANSVALGTDTTGNYVASMTAGTGITVGTATGEGSTPVITNTGVTSNVAGTGISVSGGTGAVTITNSGVTSAVAGTGVSVSGATGAVTFSIGQAVATSDNVRFNSLGIGMAASATAGRIDATNDIVAFSSSDIRFKENIKPIENAIDKIRKISGNTYDWKEENKIEHGYEGNDVGVIAQEIEAVLPQLVQTRESGYKAVKYDKLVALLIEGIKEQQLQIEQLRIDLDNCRNKGL